MAVIVNVAQYDSVPDVQFPGGVSTGAVVPIAGPLIVAANVDVDGAAAVAWSTSARFAVVTIMSDAGKIYATSAAAASPDLAVGAGQAILHSQPIIRRALQSHLLLREHA